MTGDADRLIITVVHPHDADRVNKALIDGGHGVTRINAQGGFLRRGNAVFMVGVAADQVDDAIELIRSNCQEPAGDDKSGQVYGILFVLHASGYARL